MRFKTSPGIPYDYVLRRSPACHTLSTEGGGEGVGNLINAFDPLRNHRIKSNFRICGKCFVRENNLLPQQWYQLQRNDHTKGTRTFLTNSESTLRDVPIGGMGMALRVFMTPHVYESSRKLVMQPEFLRALGSLTKFQHLMHPFI